MEKGIKDWCDRHLGDNVSLNLYEGEDVKGKIYDVDFDNVVLYDADEVLIEVLLSNIKSMKAEK